MNEARMCQLAALLDREFGKVPGNRPRLTLVRNERKPSRPADEKSATPPAQPRDNTTRP